MAIRHCNTTRTNTKHQHWRSLFYSYYNHYTAAWKWRHTFCPKNRGGKPMSLSNPSPLASWHTDALQDIVVFQPWICQFTSSLFWTFFILFAIEFRLIFGTFEFEFCIRGLKWKAGQIFWYPSVWWVSVIMTAYWLKNIGHGKKEQQSSDIKSSVVKD